MILWFKSGGDESETDIKQSVSDILEKLKELGIETPGGGGTTNNTGNVRK